MRVMSFNANGIRAAQRKGFFEWLAGQRPDGVCIQIWELFYGITNHYMR
jgi:exodeoxyribonuclease-3